MSLKGFTFSHARARRPAAIPLLLASPFLPPRELPKKPIFVVGCPRSGTTIAMRLLCLAPGTDWMRQEGHVLWESFHHPRAKHWVSGALDASDVGSIERRFIAWAIALFAGSGRFIDKTPRNVLRLPYLDALFPDAFYVFVFRDGRAIVRSLCKAWHRRGHPYRMPRGFAIKGVGPRAVRYVLPPDWQRFNGRPLEEFCAHQFATSIESLLAFRDRLAPERYVDLRYEALIADPVETMRNVYERAGLGFSEEIAERTRELVRPGTETATHAGEAIERIVPMIAPFMERTGYPV